MLKMQSCSIPGCNSYEQSAEKNIGYFRFPLRNIPLLYEWLRKINWPDWMPSDSSQICSTHFLEQDIDWETNRKNPRLLPTAVPTIFPIERKSVTKRETENEDQVAIESGTTVLQNNRPEISSVKTNDCEPHRNKITLLKRKPEVTIPGEMIPDEVTDIQKTISGIKSKLRKILSKGDASSTESEICSGASDSQTPVLEIIINEKCDDSAQSLTNVPFETIYLPDHTNEVDLSDVIKDKNEVSASQTSLQSSTNPNKVAINDHSSYSRSMLPNVNNKTSKPYVRQYSNNKLKQKTISIVPISTQSDVEIVSQDHMYSDLSAVRVESGNSKSQQESEQLRKRLEDLKERRKREQMKIARLQIHLRELEKKMKENNREEIVLPSLREGCAPVETRSNWLLREKEEYENLLKDVREIKLKVLRQRHTRELEKIKRLQMQMTNLAKKMKENDQKEIAALSNLHHTSSSAGCKPGWMEREEEEYEKLLQDVRKIKQSYNLSQSKESCSKSNTTKSVLQSENILSDEECVIIETMQKRNKLMKEIEDDNRLMHKIEREINLIDDNEGYCEVIDEINDDRGEIIGIIDEESIDIDMSRGLPNLTFNEELPDPGLLDM